MQDATVCPERISGDCGQENCTKVGLAHLNLVSFCNALITIVKRPNTPAAEAIEVSLSLIFADVTFKRNSVYKGYMLTKKKNLNFIWVVYKHLRLPFAQPLSLVCVTG